MGGKLATKNGTRISGPWPRKRGRWSVSSIWSWHNMFRLFATLVGPFGFLARGWSCVAFLTADSRFGAGCWPRPLVASAFQSRVRQPEKGRSASSSIWPWMHIFWPIACLRPFGQGDGIGIYPLLLRADRHASSASWWSGIGRPRPLFGRVGAFLASLAPRPSAVGWDWPFGGLRSLATKAFGCVLALLACNACVCGGVMNKSPRPRKRAPRSRFGMYSLAERHTHIRPCVQ